MMDLFMCLLLNLVRHGKITEATMYESGIFSHVTVKADDGIYKVTVMKEGAEDSADGND